MNLLALVSDAFGGKGGIAQYNRDLFAVLAAAGSGNEILVLVRDGKADPNEIPPGVHQLGPLGKTRFAFAALRLAATAGPFDGVFCGHLNLASLAALAARLAQVPLWLQLHGSEAWMPLSRAQHWAAARASLITAVSRYTRRRFLSLCPVDPSRVRMLPDTVGRQFRPGPKPQHLLDRYALGRRKVLLTVGRLDASEREKGHDRVIGVLPQLAAADPTIAYLIVGDGDDRARLESLARRLGVGSSVRFTGEVSAEELPDHYRLADLYVMPSTQEGFGIVFLEAAASGLPVVGGVGDGSADALADGALGRLIDPADQAALAAAIRAALDAPLRDPAALAGRFGFDNFARHAAGLAAMHLRQA